MYNSDDLTEERLTNITSASPAILYELKTKGDNLIPSWVSKNISRIIGYEAEECIGDPKWWFNHLHPNDREIAVAKVPELLSTGYLAHEYRFQHKNGHYFWIRDELRLSGREPSNVLTVVGTWMDITKRKEAEEKLHEANQKLLKLSITDQLTGLFNRRYFDEVFERELSRARREKRFLTYIMFDIDHFKKLNDHYGHIEGDKVLKQIGQKLKELFRRPGDYCFRIGGEEFGILIADQSLQSGKEFAERLCTEISNLNISNVGSNVADHLTVSVGMVAKIPTSADTMDSYLLLADDRLYRAKKLGRNQVVTSE